jgi:hypothetical protein
MIDNTVLRLVLSGVFAVTTAYHLVRVVTATPVAERVSGGWHALTGVAMVAMLWSWGMSIPSDLGILVFGGAALWFLFRASADPLGAGWYHAAMAASMTWMWGSMAQHSATAGTPTPSGMDMPGMDMAGMDHAGHQSVARSGYLLIGAGVLFLVAAAWFAAVLVRALVRTRRGTEVRGSGANVLMAAGMAACFLAAA